MLTKLLMMFPSVRRLQAAYEESKKSVYVLREQLHQEMQRNAPRAARLIVKGAMSQASVEEILAGTETNSVMQAVCAIINGKIVEVGDKACDRPRERRETAAGSFPGYSAEERTYDAGGNAYLAELLELLQDLSKPRDAAGERVRD